jgi:hypothetical protein
MATSLKAALSAIGEVGAVARVPSDFHGPRPSSARELVKACRQPQMGAWTNPERSRAENKDWTEELQGIVTDGHAWYASSNANDEREGLYKLTMSFGFIKKVEHPFDPDAVHIGALAVRNGNAFVPIQGEYGVWVVDTDLMEGEFLPTEEAPPEPDMFAWCDMNPHNGLIYTCNFSEPAPTALHAYRRVGGKLARVPKQNIVIRQPKDGKPTTHVQGACFTPNYKWLAICDVDEHERIHCHSTLTGKFLGRRSLPANTDESSVGTRNELEGIQYAPIQTGKGNLVQVHVLELNNEHHTEDDMYLWHFALPDPDAL